MRATEFIIDVWMMGRMVKEKVNCSLNVKSALGMIHRVAGTADRTYDLNRAMMAVASSNGKEFSHVPYGESWVGRSNMVLNIERRNMTCYIMLIKQLVRYNQQQMISEVES